MDINYFEDHHLKLQTKQFLISFNNFNIYLLIPLFCELSFNIIV
jgi:hypothetical protein